MTATELTLRRIGNSLGVILPAGVLRSLGIAKEGDKLHLSVGSDGALRLVHVDKRFRRKLELLQDTMKRYKNTLRELGEVTEPVWLSAADVRIFHAVLITEFGGSAGVRDEGLLESALARPQHRSAYETRDLFALAATYAHGIAKSHPFVDGNKRTAFTVARVFLGLNGFMLSAPEEEAVVMTIGLAAGEVDVRTFAAWLAKHSRRRRAARRAAPRGHRGKPPPKRT